MDSPTTSSGKKAKSRKRKSASKSKSAPVAARNASDKPSIYAPTPIKTATKGWTTYSYLKDYWNVHGKPFLNRTLVYERGARMMPKRSYVYRVPVKEHVKPGSVATNEVVMANRWAPFATKVVIEGFGEPNTNRKIGTSDWKMDVNIYVVKIAEPGIVKIEPPEGNLKETPAMKVTLNRNSSNSGPPASITVPFTRKESTRTYLLFNCKLPMTKTDRHQNPMGKRVSVKRDPIGHFGCLVIDGKRSWASDSGYESSVSMKHYAFDEDANPTTLVKGIMDQMEIPENEEKESPKLKIRIFHSYIQSLQDQRSGLPLSKQEERVIRMSRLRKIVTVLPVNRPGVAVIKKENDARASAIRISYLMKLQFDETGESPTGTAEAPPTKPTSCTKCVFCEQISSDFYALLHHYRRCHPRYSFVAEETRPSRWQVKVHPVEFYNDQSEVKIIRKGPNKRKGIPVKGKDLSKGSLYRPLNKRQSAKPKKGEERLQGLEEFKVFMVDVDEEFAERRKRLIQSHKAPYYRSVTRKELTLDELDGEDSEDEQASKWLLDHTESMIDQFTDVNEGEKAMMKMWTEHVTKEKCVADGQVSIVSSSFIEKYGRRIMKENLHRNTILHMANLHSFGLLSSTDMFKLTKRLYAFKI